MSRAVNTSQASSSAGSWDTYFERGERLIWEGKPEKGIHIGIGGIFLSLFGMPFLIAGLLTFAGGVAQFAGIEFTAFEGATGIYLMFFSLPFLAAGLGLTLGPWLIGPLAARRIRYALTDRRAYIAKSFLSRSLESYPIEPSSPLELDKGRAADCVYFYVEKYRDSDGDKRTNKVGFINIADGDQIYRLLRKIQSGEI